MGWNLPDGTTNADVDRAAGGYDQFDLAELIALKEKLNKLSPPDRLRLAAELLEAEKLPLAETIAGQVVDELKAIRILGRK